MRALFGLVSLLVVIAIIYFVFFKVEAPTIKEGEKAQDTARQISGRGDNGVPAMDSFKTQGKMKGGTLEGLTVTEVTPGWAMEKYGLKVGDEIVSINGTDVGALGDADTAKSMAVQNGFQGGNPIVVLRAGNRVTLPDQGGPGRTKTNNPQNAVQDQLKNLGVQTK